MSQFCQNCGKPIADGMRFCESCGAPAPAAAPQQPAYQQPVYQAPQQPQYQQPAYQQPQYQQPTYQQPAYQQPAYQQPAYQQPAYQQPAAQPAAKKVDVNKYVDQAKLFANGFVNRFKKDKKFQYTVIGIAAAVVLVIVLLIVLGGGGYKGAINRYIDVNYNGKYKQVEKLAPKEYWEWYEDQYDKDIDDVIDDREDSWEDTEDYLSDEYGDNFKVKFTEDKSKKLSDRKLEGIAEALEDKYDIDADKVTAGYEVEGELVIKGSEDDDDDDAEYTVIKYSGKWYLVSWYKDGDDYWASFVTG